jgi:transcriptional regulator of acetoin/glycerol metabolism
MTPNELDREEAAAREVIAALGRLSHDVQAPPDFLAHLLAKVDQRPLPRRLPSTWAIDPRGFEAQEVLRDLAADPELRAAYRDLQRALAHPQLRVAVLMTLRAFAQAAETGITIPPSGLGSVPAGAGAVDTHRSPSRPDVIEPVQRIQELPADREEPMRNIPMVSQSPKMQEVYRHIERVLHTTATVLITGESGTGKGLIARIIHDHGSRGQGPFMAVSCAAIPETLLESELFGHLERAAGGTLFVDGIAEMSPTVQAKLLRVLQEGWFDRVGGTGTLPTNARIIAAATPEFERLIAEGKFRRDLFYRLNVYPISLPPLRERQEDIIPLALHFLGRYRQVLQKEVVGLSEDVRVRLLGHAWPGNVHELMSAIEQAVRRCQGTVVTVEDLPPTLRVPGS